MYRENETPVGTTAEALKAQPEFFLCYGYHVLWTQGEFIVVGFFKLLPCSPEKLHVLPVVRELLSRRNLRDKLGPSGSDLTRIWKTRETLL